MKTVLEDLLKTNLLPWEVEQTGPQDFTLTYYAYHIPIHGGNLEELAESLAEQWLTLNTANENVDSSLMELIEDMQEAPEGY